MTLELDSASSSPDLGKEAKEWLSKFPSHQVLVIIQEASQKGKKKVHNFLQGI